MRSPGDRQGSDVFERDLHTALAPHPPEDRRAEVDVVGLDTGEAYDLILDSRTWSDQRENNLRHHQTLIQALQELSQEQDPNFKIEIEPDPDSPER